MVNKPILVLGIGNLLLSDEAVGVRAVEKLLAQYRVSEQADVMDGGTCGMELIGDMADRDHLIILDAVVTGDAPGTVVTLREDEVPVFFSRKLSPHQLGMSDVLSAMHLTGEFPKKLTLFGVVPESLEPKIGLTDKVDAQLETLVELTVAELIDSGIKVERLAEQVRTQGVV